MVPKASSSSRMSAIIGGGGGIIYTREKINVEGTVKSAFKAKNHTHKYCILHIFNNINNLSN